MDPFNLSFAGALLAGALSFASPCVLPLVPAYLCFLGGTSLDRLQDDDSTDSRRVFAASVAFVLGFSVVFIGLGASATALNRLLLDNMGWMTVVAGALIVVLGLHVMGVFRLTVLNYEKRLHVQSKPAGLLGAFVIGLAFAFGWTPCVGPILAAILMVAGSSDEMWYGTGLLGAYALGLGGPFLIAALAVKPFLAFLKRFRRHMRKVELATGSLLVATGGLILTGNLASVADWMLQAFPTLGRVG
jgi:cytochrome c-type biogenesis protein